MLKMLLSQNPADHHSARIKKKEIVQGNVSFNT